MRIAGKLFVAAVLVVVSACAGQSSGDRNLSAGWSARGFTIDDCEPRPDARPTVVKGSNPIYPVKKLIKGIEGYATLQFEITEQGTPENFRHVDSSEPIFYTHARVAMRDWVFAPPLVNGEPARVICEQGYSFSPKHPPPR